MVHFRWGLVANLILQHLYGCQSNNNNNNNNNNCVLTTRVDYYNTTCFRVTDSVFHSGDTNPAHVIQCCPDTRIEGERQIGKPANMGPFSPLARWSKSTSTGSQYPSHLQPCPTLPLPLSHGISKLSDDDYTECIQ